MIRLRPYKSCDADHIVKWIKDEVSFYQWSAGKLGSYPLTSKYLKEYYKELENSNIFWQMTALNEAGLPIGHFIMKFTDDTMKTVRLGFIIVDSAIRGQGYGKEMLQLAVKYAFDIVKVQRVTLGVFTNNPTACYCYKAIGFVEKYTDAKRFKLEGEYWSCIEMEI
jgi:RimJ/RimL family protein N-acetyltransferase